LKSDKNKGYFTKRLMYISIISRWIILRIWNISDKTFRGNQNSHYMYICFADRAS